MDPMQLPFCARFFDDDFGKMLEAVRYYNHKIKRIEKLNMKVDVYDLEVSGTHNFALASGILFTTVRNRRGIKNFRRFCL